MTNHLLQRATDNGETQEEEGDREGGRGHPHPATGGVRQEGAAQDPGKRGWEEGRKT